MDWTLLGELTDADRQRLLQHVVRRRFDRGDIVFREGEPGDTLYLIREGRVAVRASTPMGDVATFAVLGPDEFFGEQAMMRPGQPRTATIVALEPIEALTLQRAAFEQLRRAHPSVERFLTEVVAAQVRRLSAHLLEALFLPAEQRVARRLIALARQYQHAGSTRAPDAPRTGVRSPAASSAPPTRSDPITIPLTQEDLASIAGTTRPTVNRVLREMQKEQAILLRRGRIELVDLHAIRRRAAHPTRTSAPPPNRA